MKEIIIEKKVGIIMVDPKGEATVCNLTITTENSEQVAKIKKLKKRRGNGKR